MPQHGQPAALWTVCTVGLRGRHTVSDSRCGEAVQDVRELALDWIGLAERVGWGIEGPDRAEETLLLMQSIARHEEPDVDEVASSREAVGNRKLGTRPVDALFEAADLLTEAIEAKGQRRAELLGAARGWLSLVRQSL